MSSKNFWSRLLETLGPDDRRDYGDIGRDSPDRKGTCGRGEAVREYSVLHPDVAVILRG